MRNTHVFFWLLCSFTFGSTVAVEVVAEEIQVREGWVLSAERGRARRIPLPTSALDWAVLQGELVKPDRALAESPSTDEVRPWRKIDADANGNFSDRELARGWLWTYVDVPEDGVWLLTTRGSGSVRINGEPRVGDIYGNSKVVIPVRLKAGENSLVFVGARGAISARLDTPEKPVSLSLRDTTFPQSVRGESEDLWGSLMVVNATVDTQDSLALRTSGPGLTTTMTPFSGLQETALRKVGFRVALSKPVQDSEASQQSILVELIRVNADATPNPNEVLDSVEVQWDIVNPESRQRRTFLSQIDGSVQYYSVVPATRINHENTTETLSESSSTPAPLPGMVLSLHGAGVEGQGQAAVYSQKEDLTIVAPTNRRNFGFDWEDWGRWDALEVLGEAMKRFPVDSRRVYLTGHSMGGHGTWHIGTLFPDRFAAIGPSAGWISFSTYVGGIAPEEDDDAILKMLNRAAAASNTLSRVENLKTQGVYILHGDRDDNVPVDQARKMREVLAGFHPDFVYKEQPGAGHWWGNACVDWGPMINFFRDHQLPESQNVSVVDFKTPSPVVSSQYHWCELLSQQHQGEIARLQLTKDSAKRVVTGSTLNASRIALDLWSQSAVEEASDQAWTIDLDGTSVQANVSAAKPRVILQSSDGTWKIMEKADPSMKTPVRGGRFKEAFRNRFVLVYGTGGSPEQNAWMAARAKYDAETFWYRGNGSVDVVSDRDWQSVAETDRNVIVYGNSEINKAWAELLSESPVNCVNGSCTFGDEVMDDASQALLMIRPRRDSSTASIGAIGGTDIIAMRSTDRLPLFSSGSGYPDVTILSADYLTRGSQAVRVTGYFGDNWSVETGDWARQPNETSPQ